jgi:hypothetical protein
MTLAKLFILKYVRLSKMTLGGLKSRQCPDLMIIQQLNCWMISDGHQ